MSLLAKKQNRKQSKQISSKKASQIVFKSEPGPLSEMTDLQRSLFLAECSMMSYLSPEECNAAAGKLGFTDGNFYNSKGAQAYWFHNEHDSVIVCRGTEPNEWNDISADANALTAVAETIGKVHRGFKAEVDELWPYIEESLKENTRPLWFCGHSLGGAMATICASRCLLSHIKCEPDGLYTFGSPRVGCRKYTSFVKVHHLRWVNNNDIVARVPPVWLGYRHSGQEMYLDRNGKLRDMAGWKRLSDRVQGFFKELTRFRIDQLSDHSILDYIRIIHTLVKQESASGSANSEKAA